ncbi:MAG: FHA domain-containing protein [Planctomycetota bacterium]|nr:FHA domain-containing protein [Planctomycetota bacterium]
MGLNTQWDHNSEAGTSDALLENTRNLHYLVANYGLSSADYFESLHPYPFLIQKTAEQSDEGLHVLQCPVYYVKKQLDTFPDRILAGRLEQNDITIPVNKVSGHHAFFYKKNAEWFVVDNNSRNGIIIGQERLDPNVPRLLKSGMELYFGRSVSLRFISEKDMFGYLTDLYNSVCQFPSF